MKQKIHFLLLSSLFLLIACQQQAPTIDHELLTMVGQALPNHHITFASPRGIGNSDIWIVGVDGTGERNLTDGQNGTDLYPEWGPKGDYIYYTSNKHGGTLELYRVNTAGTPQPQQLTQLNREVRSLAISADDQRIALGVMTADVPLGADLKPYSADLFFLHRDVLDKTIAENRLISMDDLELVLSEPQTEHVWY
ncbi:MAG: DPP IV N-terminal domain-containing protein [Chloroflexota bacterium]